MKIISVWRAVERALVGRASVPAVLIVGADLCVSPRTSLEKNI